MEINHICLMFIYMFASSNGCSTRTSINNDKHQPGIESVDCYRSPFCNKTRNYFNASQYLPFNFKMFDNEYAYYLSTEPEKWTPTCLHYGSNFDSVLDPIVFGNIFNSLPNVSSVWEPAKREADSQYFQYELPSIKNAPSMSLNWTNDCLIWNQNKSHLDVNCNEKHHTLCIWDTTYLNLLQLACNERAATTWFSKYQDTCFSIIKIDEVTDNITIAVIDSAEKQFIFTKLLEWYNDTTVNGPILFNTIPDSENTARGRFRFELWMKSTSEKSFVNWEEEINATNETVYSVIDPETGHWTLQEENAIQFVFVEEKMTLKTPTIQQVIEEEYNNGLTIILTNYKHFYNNGEYMLPINCKSTGLDFKSLKTFYLETYKNERDEDVQSWELRISFEPLIKYYEVKCIGYAVPNFAKVIVVFELIRNLGKTIHDFIFTLNILDKDFRNYMETDYGILRAITGGVENIYFKNDKSNGVTEHVYHVIYTEEEGSALELRQKIQMLINDTVSSERGANYVTEFRKLYNPEVFHTEICLSDDLRFPNVRIGEVSIFTDFCVVKQTGLPPFLDCAGSHIIGARWSKEPTVDLNECIVESDIPVSQLLYNLTQHQNHNNTLFTSEENVETIIGLVGNHSVKRAADIVYIAQVLHAASKIAGDKLFPDEVNSFMDSLINLTDKAITIDKETLRKSQMLNSTNSIVGSLELVAEKISNSREFNESYLRIEDNAIVMIGNPSITNIIGIAIFASSKSRKWFSFKNCTVREIYHNHTINNNSFSSFLAENGVLEVAAYVPLGVWESMNTSSGIQNRLVFIIYKNYTLFQERRTNQSIAFDDNPIVRILIPNHKINLQASAVIIFRNSQLTDKKGLTTYNAAGFGKWNETLLLDCTNRPTEFVEYHLDIQATVGFARLLSSYIPCLKIDLGYHQVIITMLTYVISVLSILGASVIILTYAIFPSFRKRLKSTLIPQISLSIILEHVLLQYSVIAGEESFGSFPISFLFHYIVLVSFSLTIFSSKTHYYRFVVIMQYYEPVSHELKIFLIGWGCPLLFVSGSVLVHYFLSQILQLWMDVKDTCDCSGAICLSSYIILRGALHFPLLLMLIYNARVFYRIVVKFAQRETHLDGFGTSAPQTMGNKFVIGLLVKMAFSFSLTWIFGFWHIYVSKNTASHIISSYLFSIFGGLQGFIFFLFVVVLDPSTRTSWCTLLHLNKREEYAIRNIKIRKLKVRNKCSAGDHL